MDSVGEFIGLILYSIVDLLMVTYFVVVGRELFRMKSILKALENYEANPAEANWIEKYFMGWRWSFQRSFWRGLIKVFGDKSMSVMQRATGVLFFFFAFSFFGSLILIWATVIL